MSASTPGGGAEHEWRSPRRWGPFFAGVWLIFLVQPIADAVQRGTARGYAGATVLVAFALTYLFVAREFRAVITRVKRRRLVVFVPIGVMFALSALAVALLGVSGLSSAPYLAVLGPIVFGRWGVAWIAGVAALAELVSRWLAHSWSDTQGLATGTLAAGLAVWGFVLVLQRNADQSRAREVEARLAVISERDRFARDLHDILGHSLTVITIKAELAGRLLETAPERARAEVADLERLARTALADVRRAVAGYREITLSGELDRAREALLSAGMSPVLPIEVPELPADVDELYAWTVREGVTNVLRHSRADRCTITVSPSALVITDDGRGAADPGSRTDGNGIRGLRERADEAGLRFEVGAAHPYGTRLEVSVPDLARGAPGAPEATAP